MWFVQILAFLAVSLLLSLHYDEDIVSVIPVNIALMLFVLLILALFRQLSFIDILAFVVIICCFVVYYRRYGTNCLEKLFSRLFSPSALSLYIILLLSFLLFKDRLISGFDDLHCWALEVKSIYYYDGFAPKYKHAAIAYGNYFPGTTLWRWWACHLIPEFTEGMIVVGNVWLCVLLLSPLFSIVGKNIISGLFSGVFSAVLLLFLPGVLDFMSYRSLCAELPMSTAFAVALYSILFASKKLRLPLLASNLFFLTFFKVSGIAYAVLVVLLILVFKKAESRWSGEQRIKDIKFGHLLKVGVLCVLPTLIWLVFCRYAERSDYFRVSFGGAGDAGISAMMAEPIAYFKALLSAVFVYPAHYVNDGLINLSTFSAAVILLLLWHCAGKLAYIPQWQSRLFVRIISVLCPVLFIAVLFMHSYVFHEGQYFSPNTAAISFSRYSLPFFLGMFILIIYIFLCKSHGKKRLITAILIVACVFACSCSGTVYSSVINYSPTNTLDTRTVLLAGCEDFLSQSQELRPEADSLRYLFVYEQGNISDEVLIKFMAAPDSIVFLQLPSGSVADVPVESLIEIADSYHADYLYFPSDSNQDSYTFLPIK